MYAGFDLFKLKARFLFSLGLALVLSLGSVAPSVSAATEEARAEAAAQDATPDSADDGRAEGVSPVPVNPPKPPVKPVFSTPFSFEALQKIASQMANAPYVPPEAISSPWLNRLGYDAYRQISYQSDHAIWRKEALIFNLEFFHLGGLYTQPVQLFEVRKGQAYRLAYDPALFDFGSLSLPAEVAGEASDYAGFRVHSSINRPDRFDEFLVFLGASYFRGVGKDQVYGLSARGLAIDTALPKGEEFPIFKSFWIEKPAPRADTITIYALLDSPSITGAYRFVTKPGRTTTMDVQARLYPRKDIQRMGVAPLTSMYAFGENNDRLNRDFRPEVHDSDGLRLNNGNGEWLWRPLINPRELSVSTYSMENPRGFGLMQRDRAFSSYEDLEARYEDRPSLWVEPKGDWGRGAVQLVEIPTNSEIHDNIVAYWVPEEPVKAGSALAFDYRLGWGDGPDTAGRPAAVLSTLTGRQFSDSKPKFVIDFEGLSGRYQKEQDPPQIDLWTSKGTALGATVFDNPHTKGWRVTFDLESDDRGPYELRCFLKWKDRVLTETWSYQWRPEQ